MQTPFQQPTARIDCSWFFVIRYLSNYDCDSGFGLPETERAGLPTWIAGHEVGRGIGAERESHPIDDVLIHGAIITEIAGKSNPASFRKTMFDKAHFYV